MKKSKISLNLRRIMEKIGLESKNSTVVSIKLKNYGCFEAELKMPIDKRVEYSLKKILKINTKVVDFLKKCPESQWQELSRGFILVGAFIAKLTPAQILELEKFKEVELIFPFQIK